MGESVMDMVFVYGSLMKGYEYHQEYLTQAEFLGKGEIKDYALYAVDSYPGIVYEDGEKVKGEVYKVDANTLHRLDILEEEGSLYLRKKVRVRMDHKTVEAWTYIWNGETKDTKKIHYEDQPWKG